MKPKYSTIWLHHHRWVQSLIAIIICLITSSTLAIPTVESLVKQSKDSPQMQLLIISELMGYIEPCGCTVDLKLGSIERLDALIQSTRAHTPTHILTVGSHLFDHAELKEHSLAQERSKAKLIRSIMSSWPVDAHLDGLLDKAAGEHFYGQLKQSYPLNTVLDHAQGKAFKVIEKSGFKLGVIALDDTLQAESYQSLLSSSIHQLKAHKVHFTVVISTMKRSVLRKLAQKYPYINLWVLGQSAQEAMYLSPVEHNQSSTRSYILEAGDRGRHLGLIKLYGMDLPGTFTDVKGDLEREKKSIELKIKMRKKFSAMSKSPFMQKGLQQLESQLAALNHSEPPKVEKRIEYDLIPITKDLPVSETVAAQVQKYQSSLASLNMEAASQVKPPPANGNGYAGTAECSLCHPQAEEFWKTTRHAKAWETLEKAKKTFDVGCVGCHVTGWQEPGGSALGHTDKLQDVQCEACHGPAAKHAEIGGGESYVNLKVPSEKCETCHNHLHSPKFNYKSYLIKIIGPGHGEPLPSPASSD